MTELTPANIEETDYSKILAEKITYLRQTEIPKTLIIQKIEESEESISIWQIAWWLISQPLKIIKAIYYIINILGYFNMEALKNWQTTIPAIIAGIFSIIQVFGVTFPNDFINAIPIIITGLILLFTDPKQFLADYKTLIPSILGGLFIVLTFFHVITIPIAVFSIIINFIIMIVGLFANGKTA